MGPMRGASTVIRQSSSHKGFIITCSIQAIHQMVNIMPQCNNRYRVLAAVFLSLSFVVPIGANKSCIPYVLN